MDPIKKEEKVVEFLYQYAESHKLKRDADKRVYQCGIPPNGIGCFYHNTGNLEAFIRTTILACIETNPEFYDTIRSKTAIDRIASMIHSGKDPRFPEISLRLRISN